MDSNDLPGRIYNKEGEEVVPITLPKKRPFLNLLKGVGQGVGIGAIVIAMAFGAAQVVGSDEQERQTNRRAGVIVKAIERIEDSLSEQAKRNAGIAKQNQRVVIEIECLLREHENPDLDLRQCVLEGRRQGGDEPRRDSDSSRQR